MVVATITLAFAPGVASQQWMCDAVVVPVNPLKLISTRIEFSAGSRITNAVPVPVEWFRGLFSFALFKSASKVSGIAWAVGPANMAAAATNKAESSDFISPSPESPKVATER